MRYRYRSEWELKYDTTEWFEKIPTEWKKLKGKWGFSNSNEKGSSEDILLSATQDKGIIPKVMLEGVVQNREDADLSNFKLVKKGDFVISLRSFQGGFEMSEYERGIITPAYSVLRARTHINIYFFKYLFKERKFINKINSLTTGIRDGKSIRYEEFCNVMLPVPTLDNQEVIVKFLDEKTAQFDSIISKKEALIQKLEEVKKSLISEVVTGKVKVVKTSQGYELVERDRDEMKDSGVEWLGDIPKEWDIRQVKHVATLNPPKSLVKKYVKEDIKVTFLAMDSVRLGYINVEQSKNISEVIDGYTYFENDDIIMAKVTPCFENRNIAICKDLKNGIGFGSTELNTIRCFDKDDIEYLFYNLQEENFMKVATYEMTGAGGLKRVPSSFIVNAKFVYPEKAEKNLIVGYLNEKMLEMEKVINKTKNQIEKLKEAKQSLISEAVTGKIEILD